MVELDFNSCQRMFICYLERMEFSSETVRGYQKDLEFFHRFMNNRKGSLNYHIDVIQKADLIAFMDYGKGLGHQTNTIARRIATIKSFYKFLVMEMDYPIDVAARVKLPKTYVPLRGILTEEEVARLLDDTKQVSLFYHLLFATLYYTGSRLTPVRTLKWEDVHIQKRMIYFPKVKGGKDLYIPMHGKLVTLFEEEISRRELDHLYVFPSPRMREQPISAGTVRKKLCEAVLLANINKKVTPHTIRHTTATHLTLKRVDQRTIAAILGHADLRSTMRYQHLSIEHLREPLAVL